MAETPPLSSGADISTDPAGSGWIEPADDRLFRSIVAHAADAIIAIDRNGRIILFNPAATAMFGHAADDILGRNIKMLLPERLRARHDGYMDSFARDASPARHMGERQAEIMGLTAAGEEIPLDISICRTETASGTVMVAIVRDRSEQHRTQRHLEDLANTDALTGALNRRAFMAGAKSLCATAARYHRDCALLMLDIDHFKKINDTYGHTVGDDVLKETFERILENLRASDLLGRWGGEEFVAILPETGLMGARVTAERIRESLGGTPIVLSRGEHDAGTALTVTASVGVTAMRARDDGPGPMIARADQALYRAKRAGRDRVMVAEEAGAK
ncbi:MAG: sensor domain-containing diguanylate cyclase [Alphaproteobacteria bacterium]